MNEFRDDNQKKAEDPPDFEGFYELDESGEYTESYADLPSLNPDYINDLDTPNWLEVKVAQVEERRTKHKNPRDRIHYLMLTYVTVDGNYKHKQTYFKQREVGRLQKLLNIKKLTNPKQLLGRQFWVHLGLRSGTGPTSHQQFADIDSYSLERREDVRPSFGQGEELPF